MVKASEESSKDVTGSARENKDLHPEPKEVYSGVSPTEFRSTYFPATMLMDYSIKKLKLRVCNF